MLTELQVPLSEIAIGVVGVINVVAFLIMWFDKKRSSKSGARRISEGHMFFLATLLGSLGVYVGMFVFRHKTQKWYFLVGIPLLMMQNIALLYMLYQILGDQVL